MERLVESCPLRGQELRVGRDRVGQRRAKLARHVGDHRSEAPVRVMGVRLPVDAVRIEKDARPGPDQEFVDLAAHVAEVDVRGVEVGHVRQRGAVGVDQDIRRAAVLVR